MQDITDSIKWLKSQVQEASRCVNTPEPEPDVFCLAQPFVDGERIGIWGWSYGGYMTSYALTHSNLFKVHITYVASLLFGADLYRRTDRPSTAKVGISGAPVTDWRLYDTIYTERYMGTPQSNPDGYDKSSLLTSSAAQSLHGKLLLLHGTMDDNVHLQQSVQFIYQLQRAVPPLHTAPPSRKPDVPCLTPPHSTEPSLRLDAVP